LNDEIELVGRDLPSVEHLLGSLGSVGRGIFLLGDRVRPHDVLGGVDVEHPHLDLGVEVLTGPGDLPLGLDLTDAPGRAHEELCDIHRAPVAPVALFLRVTLGE
jgi:hypothetical protein